MPCWWPNHLIDWTQIKNLSHKYEGYLGNTYSNCLRIAVIRGYAHYGLDANDYVEKTTNGTAHGNAFNLGRCQGNFTSLMDRKKNQTNFSQSEEEIVIEPAFYGNEDSMDSSVIQSDEDGVIRVDGTPVTAPVSVQSSSGGMQTMKGLDPRLPTEPLPLDVANCRQSAASAGRPVGMLSSQTGSKSYSETRPVARQGTNASRHITKRPFLSTTYVNLKGNHMRNIVENNELTQRRNRNPSPKVVSRKNLLRGSY